MIAMLISAFAPGIALLTYFYLKDRYAQEPILLVLRMFFFGALIGFPIMIIQYGINTEVSQHPLFQSYITAGLLEEFFKWFLLYFLIFHHVEFDEPYDGVVYAVAVSLGFASLENFLYIFSNGLSVALLRALVPVSGHALFGVVMGYYMGKAKFLANKKDKPKLVLISLFMPVFLHGSYDYLIMVSHLYWVWSIIPFMAWLWWFALQRVRKANEDSKISSLRTHYKKEFVQPVDWREKDRGTIQGDRPL